jgi:hypothetical protein
MPGRRCLDLASYGFCGTLCGFSFPRAYGVDFEVPSEVVPLAVLGDLGLSGAEEEFNVLEVLDDCALVLPEHALEDL